MRRVLIFGNSGSGKSTLAKHLSESPGLAHFDLDSIAWLPTDPPQRAPISGCADQIDRFMTAHEGWVIEGCYADLIEIATVNATELIFLDLCVDDCIANAKRRPWEPHKYSSKESQDAKLDMLVNWITAYPDRTDSCSRPSHVALYERFQGWKKVETRNHAFRQQHNE